MIVVADSSPLIALAKIDSFSLFHRLYEKLHVSSEVYAEVVVRGAGLAGSTDVSSSSWIEVVPIKHRTKLASAQRKTGLGLGELSTIILANEIDADLIIFDDLGARKLAQRQGFKVQGSIAILEAGFRKGYLLDLREAYLRLLAQGIYLNRELLNYSLKTFSLPFI